MLENPDIDDSTLAEHVDHLYGLFLAELEFLPLGADPGAAVYRAVAKGGSVYFVKLKRGGFAEASVTLPGFFSEQGLKHIISPLPTKRGELWTRLNAFTVVVYPFVTGQNGYAVPMTERNWLEFGRTLKKLHTLELRSSLKRHIQLESYDARWRKQVKDILTRLEHFTLADETSMAMASFLLDKRAEILELVAHAERFAQDLQNRTLEPVLCHADLHAGNLLIDETQNFYIVDWDAPILAPKERDLMFIGGGLGFKGFTPQEEEELFYWGYGPAQVNSAALAYYRFERIVQDIAVYGDELVRQLGSDEARKESLSYLKSNFEPGGTIERAYAVAVTE